MRNRLSALAAAVFAVGGIGLISPAFGQAAPGADQQQQQQQPGQAAGGAGAGSGAQQPSGAAGQAADRSGAGAQQAASQSDVGQVLAQTAQSQLGAQGLSGSRICQKDRQRLGDLSQQGQQIQPAVDQLKQAYKAKYNKDLDLSADPNSVFTATFFRIGDASDQARQASARIGATGSDTAGGAAARDTGAGAAAAKDSGAAAPPAAGQGATAGGQPAYGAGADAAQTAAGMSGGDALLVIIPASHGMPEARLNLVKEANQWAINIPDSMDAQQLGQKFQQQVQQLTAAKDQWPADAKEAQQAISHGLLLVFAEPASPDAAGAGGAPGAAGGPGAPGSAGGAAGGAAGSGGPGATPNR